MKIRGLRIAGFKSFVDPVEVRIDHGLTGVVGPNGCGKSNILESIRWAMGASSARALRGGDMDDVIFSGADGRPARDLAEVTLVIDNSEHRAPAQFNASDTLEVMRRIRRGAGSTYRINGREVRGRDVQMLFADASTGANSPSLVRQGQVSELINAKPENRRRILEEAAGVAGLHARRHEAEGKLKAAEANLARLDDVVLQMNQSLDGLRRQARQAERYRALAAEIRGLEAYILSARWLEAEQAVVAARSALDAAEADIGTCTARLSEADRAVVAAEEALPAAREEQAVADALRRRHEGAAFELDRELKAAEDRLEAAKAEIARIRTDKGRESQLAADAATMIARLGEDLAALPQDETLEADEIAARTRAEAAATARQKAEEALTAATGEAAAREGRLRALRDAAAAAEARRVGAARALEAAQGQRASLPAPDEAALAAATAAVAQAEAEAEAARADADAAEAAAEAAQTAAQAAVEAARTAEAALSRCVAEIDGLAAVVRRAAGSGAHPPVLGDIKVQSGFEKALAAALGDELEASLAERAPARWAGGRNADAPRWPDAVRPLSEVVTAPEALAARLAMVGVIEGEGASLARTLPVGARLVSLRGDLWRWDGFIRSPDAASAAAALLERRNRLEALTAERPALETAKAETARVSAQARAAADAARDRARVARARPGQAQSALAQARTRLAAVESETRRRAIAREGADAAVAEADARLAEATAAATAAAAERDTAPPAADPAALEAARAAAAEARSFAASCAAEAAGIAGRLAEQVRRRAQLARDLEAWTARAATADSRLTALDSAEAAAIERRAAAEEAPGAIAQRRARLLDEAPKVQARVKAASDSLAQAETAARTARDAAREAHAALSTAREARGTAHGRLEAALAKALDLAEQARTAQRVEPEALLAQARAELGEEAITRLKVHEAEPRLERLRRERDGMGAVNLRAEIEAGEQEEKLGVIEAEKADLVAAIAKLRQAIGEINAEGRERLLAAFEQVQGHFRVLFESLFDGGSAELRLTETDDPLSGGLEIFACPPGKKLASMSLMSGGEQALTATALIFAVFLSNPSPICVLDEVDAPLDDANVDRFCRMLEEMRKRTETRFLVITHHPVTMARMDRLYGVTMMDRGVSQLVAVDLRRAEELVAA